VPFKLNQDRRHHIPRQQRNVTNWPAYDRWCTEQISERVALSPTQCDLCDTDREWAPQLQHAVHHVHGDGDFGGATITWRKRSRYRLLAYSSESGLNTAALIVARHLLPAEPAVALPFERLCFNLGASWQLASNVDRRDQAG
jgi:hypothetical protein